MTHEANSGHASRPEDQVPAPPSVPSSSETARLDSLDVFRGITIASMILVNNLGNPSSSYAPLLHAEWHGCTPTDWIFPFFLFIVGVAMAFSLAKRRAAGGSDRGLIAQAFRRSLILFVLGVMINTFPIFDIRFSPLSATAFEHLDTFRISGVLQRIGICYFLTTLILLRTGIRGQVLWTAGVLVGYWVLMTWVPVPGYGAGKLSATDEAANFGAFVDRLLLGNHLASRTWDSTGFFGCVPGVANVLLGVLAGHVLRSGKPPAQKIRALAITGAAGIGLGWIWGGCPAFDHFLSLGEPTRDWMGLAFPMNKSLWTSSYVLFTCGLAMVGLAGCYAVVDVKGWKAWVFPFVVFGMNSILAFFLSSLFKRILVHTHWTLSGGMEVSTRKYLYQNFFQPLGNPQFGSLVYALAMVILWFGTMAVLHRKRIFFKV